jgi:hypothetical protein
VLAVGVGDETLLVAPTFATLLVVSHPVLVLRVALKVASGGEVFQHLVVLEYSAAHAFQDGVRRAGVPPEQNLLFN